MRNCIQGNQLYIQTIQFVFSYRIYKKLQLGTRGQEALTLHFNPSASQQAPYA